jgi:two-component sensor histidine kinase
MAPPASGGTGTQIVDSMLRHGGGHIERRWHPDGLEATIEIPA